MQRLPRPRSFICASIERSTKVGGERELTPAAEIGLFVGHQENRQVGSPGEEMFECRCQDLGIVQVGVVVEAKDAIGRQHEVGQSHLSCRVGSNIWLASMWQKRMARLGNRRFERLSVLAILKDSLAPVRASAGRSK